MRYFTSDLHLGDKTIARWRGFDDVAEHDAMILSGINDTVTEIDELWLLGDLCRARVEDVRAMRDAIRCRLINVVVGNHDSRSKFLTCGGFVSVEYYAEVGRVVRDGYKFVMSHYPMLDWDRAYHGSYMLHGHIHSLPSNVPDSADFINPPSREDGGMGMRGYNTWNAQHFIRRYDVGVDANGYRPVSAEDIIAALPDNAAWSEKHQLPVD